MFEYLAVEIDAATGVNRIDLNQPEVRNALSGALVAELKEALALAAADTRVRLILLGGRGPDFCAGADLTEVSAAMEEGVLASLADAENLGELFVLMRRVEKPIVAAVHGKALGGGSGLALASDLVLASSSARFGFPEVRLGFVPAMVAATVRRNIGEKAAFELFGMAEIVVAETALRLGLVNRVFSDDDFEDEVDGFARTLATRSGSALALTKRLLYGIDGQAFEGAIAAGARVNALARMTEDCREGIGRFVAGKGRE